MKLINLSLFLYLISFLNSFVSVLPQRSDFHHDKQIKKRGSFSLLATSTFNGGEPNRKAYEPYRDYENDDMYPPDKYALYHQPAVAATSPLLRQATTYSLGIFFFVLIWRTVSIYELADQFSSGFIRFASVVPTVFLFCANILGFLANLTRPLNFKSQLKAILAMNMIREVIEMIYNTIMLVINIEPSNIPREVYFGRFFTNVWILLLCTTFSKSRWILPPTRVEPVDLKRQN